MNIEFIMDEKVPFVSLTLAAFNVADHLSECLDSLLAQSHRNFELIVVDDASTDATREILLRYARANGHMKLILKDQNEGLSVARNEGIAAARGEYVTFLDGDDVYAPDMVRSAVDAARNSGADVVMWDYLAFWDPCDIPRRLKKPSALASMDPSDRRAVLSRPAFAWTKLVRRELLQRLDVQFPCGLTYQDVLVHWQLVTQARIISLVPKRLCYYRQHPKATTSGRGMRRADYFTVLDLVESDLRNRGVYAVYQELLLMTQLNAWHSVYYVISAEHRSKVLALINQRLTLDHLEYALSKKPLRWQARKFYQAMQGSPLSSVAHSLWIGLRSVYRTIRSVRRTIRRVGKSCGA